MRPYQNEAERWRSVTSRSRTGSTGSPYTVAIDLTRDKAGLENARALKQLLDDVVRVLEGDPALPEHVAPPKAPVMKRNPFA